MATQDDLIAALHSLAATERLTPEHVRPLLADALADSTDWLHPAALRRDPAADWALHPLLRTPRCSLIVAVFRPGAVVPVHDHGAWAVIGIYRGRERETRYRRAAPPSPLQVVDTLVNEPGAVVVVPEHLPHTVVALDGRDAISLHAYGTDIVTQQRSEYDVDTGRARPYQPGFAAART
jgi:3-mercaptopropionate dioxygenase